MLEHVGRRHDVADVERPEFGVAGAGFVEPHGVDDVFEKLWIAGPEGDAPFPIVETGRGRDQLGDFAAEGHAGAAVLGHQAAAFGEGEREPVFAHLAFFVHWIEAGGWPRWQVRREPLLAHHFFAAFVGFEFGFVSGAVALFAFLDEPVAVLLECGDVFGNFGDGGEGISGDDCRAEATGQEAVVDGADFKRVGVEQHEAEVGFVTGDDAGLQAGRGVGAGGVKDSGDLLAAAGDLGGVHRG